VKETPGLPRYDREQMWISMDELLTWNPQSDVAKPYPAAPRGGKQWQN
jgi:NADH-quinone oxidoreductase subunit I